MLNARELEQIVAAMNAMRKVVVNGEPFIHADGIVGVLKTYVAKDDLDMLRGTGNEPRGNETCR